MITIFWGAGIVGKRRFEEWNKLGMQVDYFGDNNLSKRGTLYCGIPVVSAEDLLDMENYVIHITCSQKIIAEVYEGLLQRGIQKSKIILDYGLTGIYSKIRQELKDAQIANESKIDVLFDLQNGYALGGVETWSFDSVELIEKRGFRAGYLVNTYANNWYLPQCGESVEVPNIPGMDFYEHCIRCAKKILELRPKVIVINFPQTIFLAACVIKSLFPDQITVIAVMHNDEKTYYDLYSTFRKDIDCFWVISNKIKGELSARGTLSTQMKYLPWYIKCGDVLKHNYSTAQQPITIGYAGRLTIIQKRADLLLKLAKNLKKLNVNFLFEIAGEGDYAEKLKAEIKTDNMESNVILRDYVAHEEINKFWMDKDIAVNLSDFEGRSISKAEAMAAGAVPIMTDTSGMRDDIEDGYNGYIVSLEDVDLAAQKVEYLYNNRSLIPQMGMRAYEAIKTKNTEKAVGDFWNIFINNYLEK